MSAALNVDKDAFFRRAKRLYKSWRDEASDLNKVDSIVIAVGTDDETVYSKSQAIQVWLLGLEMSDTLLVFTEKGIYVLASKKKIDYLKPLESSKENEKYVPPINLLVRNKNDKDRENYTKILNVITASKNGKVIGEFSKDKYTNEFITEWLKVLSSKEVEKSDISSAMALVMAPKDEAEIEVIKKSSSLACEVYQKYLREEITNIIDDEKKVKHSKLTEGTEKAIADKKYIKNADIRQVEPCYSPIIQSGGNYNLKFSAVSDKNNLHFGAICCFLGIRYKMYCSNLVRTMMVNPTEKQKDNYEFLVQLEDHVLTGMKEGVTFAQVYKRGADYVKENRPDLVDKLTRNFGFVTGIEFREGSLLITEKNTTEIKAGMVFNLSIGFSELKNPEATDAEGKIYALYLADTVLTFADKPAECLTLTKKKLSSIAILLKDEADESEEEEEKEDPKPQDNLLQRGKRTTVIENKLREDKSAEDKRKLHQKELAESLNEQARARLSNAASGPKEQKSRKSVISYRSLGQMPKEPEVKELKLFVDKKYETVILPIFGVPVPFHISTIKNISQSVEGDYTYLRINFFHPGSTLAKAENNFAQPDASFLKELTYRSTNIKEPGEISAPSSNLNTAFRLIKEVQKKFKTREAEEREKEGVVKQDTLILSANKGNPKLKDLFIRPNIINKRIVGTLEAHQNGFRYTSIRGDKVDILYNNIKHAFFQPCDGEMVILLHFTLKNFIMFNKKRHYDVQFYTEVGELTTDLGKHHNMHDRDDLAAEQAERELRNKLKAAFKMFVDKVEAMTKQEVEFDTPFRDLSFAGVPNRSIVLLQPTSGCLINLTDQPPFVITLEEVELVHFERVQFHLKNFDMVFVFKDYTKKVAMINAVPMSSLDAVKQWLDSCDIRYTEGIQSLNWTKIMKTIVDDPEGFFDQGGWTFLDPESDAENGEDDDEDEEDDQYTPTESEASDEEDSEEDSDELEEDESEMDYSDEELATSEESGKDWSELEEEARKADKDHNEYDEPAQKKRAPLPSSKNRQPSRSFSSSKHRSPSKHGSSFKRKDDHHHHKSSSSSKKFKK